MKDLLTDALAWKKKRLFSFSRFDLREMHLERIGSGGPLVLKFDRLDDSWTASKDGKDETLNINPNRANRYLDELEKMEVSAWLPYTDATAHEALKNPVFRLKLILQSYKEAPPRANQIRDRRHYLCPGTGNGGQSHHAGNRPGGGGRIQQILLRQSKYNPELFYPEHGRRAFARRQPFGR